MRRSNARWRGYDGRYKAGGAVPQIGGCADCGKLFMPDFPNCTDRNGFAHPLLIADARKRCAPCRAMCLTTLNM